MSAYFAALYINSQESLFEFPFRKHDDAFLDACPQLVVDLFMHGYGYEACKVMNFLGASHHRHLLLTLERIEETTKVSEELYPDYVFAGLDKGHTKRFSVMSKEEFEGRFFGPSHIVNGIQHAKMSISRMAKYFKVELERT